MSPSFSAYPHDLTDTVLCPKCGNCGVISWDSVPTPRGLEKYFVGISGDFYERLSNKPPYPIEIVCGSCRIPVAPETPKSIP
jgi:hypothetical protein